MIIRNGREIGEVISGALLKSVMAEHLRDKPRRDALRAAYDNKRDILGRKRGAGLPNNRLAHGFARYIVTLSGGYLIGKPVAYTAKNGQEEALENVLRAYRRADAGSVDAELAKSAGIFGRGVELCFADREARPRLACLDPENAFVVYDDTVARAPLFGVHMAPRLDMDGLADGVIVTAYTAREIYTYCAPSLDALDRAEIQSVSAHFFGAVPMVEYWNNEDETGDFEQVQTLIDAYDLLESDRLNDKEQFVDALLVLTGVTMGEDEKGRTPGQQLRQDKVLCLPDRDCTASFLARSLPEEDVEVLRRALKEDIHKFSMVPDLSDAQFAGNASGVAMRYKLLGFEQLMCIKERWFREALRERLRLFASFMEVKGAKRLDADDVSMTFTRSLPVNELEIAQTVEAYHGIVPDELLFTQVPFITDVKDALSKR